MRIEQINWKRAMARIPVCLCLALMCVIAGGPRADGRDNDVSRDFQRRVDAYVSLQKKALATVPSIPKEGVTDVRLLETRQEKLVEAIRALRPNAKRGDLFTPEIAKMFTTTIQTVLRGANAVDVRETILGEGNPANPESPAVVRLTVNAVYPAGAPLSTMPPSLLLVLPSLPKGVEYRFVGRNLILLDTHANLIVDIAPNAFTHETITSKQSRL